MKEQKKNGVRKMEETRRGGEMKRKRKKKKGKRCKENERGKGEPGITVSPPVTEFFWPASQLVPEFSLLESELPEKKGEKKEIKRKRKKQKEKRCKENERDEKGEQKITLSPPVPIGCGVFLACNPTGSGVFFARVKASCKTTGSGVFLVCDPTGSGAFFARIRAS